MAVDPTSRKSPIQYEKIEKPKFYGEMAKLEKPLLELKDAYNDYVKPMPRGEYFDRTQQKRQEEAFNKAFESLLSKLTPEEEAAFREDPVAFLESHPEYTKPGIEAVPTPPEEDIQIDKKRIEYDVKEVHINDGEIRYFRCQKDSDEKWVQITKEEFEMLQNNEQK